MSDLVDSCPNCILLLKHIEELLARIEHLEREVADLRERLDGNSRNSSRPPSTDLPNVSRPTKPKTGRKRGGQPGHPHHPRTLLPLHKGDRLVTLRPERCDQCHTSLAPDLPDHGEPVIEQVVDLPEQLRHVTQYKRHSLQCTGCGRITRAARPAEASGGMLGAGMLSLVALLTGRFRHSHREVREFLRIVHGVPVSLGMIAKAQARVSEVLAPAYDDVLEQARESAVANVDETGWRVAQHRSWLWVFVTERASVFRVSRYRSREAFKALAGDFSGITGSDRYGAYTHLPVGKRQICWAHLKRDFQKIMDRGGEHREIGEQLQEVCDEVFALWHLFRGGGITRNTLELRMQWPRGRMYEILDEGQGSGLPKTATLCGNLFGVFESLFTFVSEAGVEPTNNAAERALRPGVLWRKGSFGSDSEGGARFVERMMTVVATLRAQQRDLFEWLTAAVAAHTFHQAPPSLFTQRA